MPTPGRIPHADAAAGGVRLTLPLTAGSRTAEIVLEPAHCERLFRGAAYGAIRDGRLRIGQQVTARLVPGRVRDRHNGAICLESCAVELIDRRGALAARVEFPRVAFAAFVAARAVRLLVESREAVGDGALAYSLHATASADEPFTVVIPALPRLSVEALAASALPRGAPESDWVATFVSAAVGEGLEEIERVSRASGVEAAGRIHARVGFDPARRCLVRVLERLVISRATRASAVAVVSTAASWAEFLATAPAGGAQAYSSVHTHLHTPDAPGADGVPGDHLLASGASLRPDGEPCISINDVVTHYTTFPDPLSAALIVSLFPDRRVVTLYGYTPRAQLREEPGYWLLPDRAA